MRTLYVISISALLLNACETHQAKIATILPQAAVVAEKVASHRPKTAPPDTIDISQLPYTTGSEKAITDTVLKIGARRYFLQLQAQTDSSELLQPAYTEAPAVDSAGNPLSQAGDARHFYNVRYTITLADSARHRLFQRVFFKKDFYPAMGKEIVVESEPITPELLGYNAPRQLLLFRQLFAVEGTDWAGDAFLTLDLIGKVHQLTGSNGYGGGGSDCRIQQSPDGQAIITCRELLMPGGRHQRLTKPNCDLTVARFLSDTTLLTIYDYVRKRRVKHYGIWGMESEPDPRHQNTPNAFILSARTGKILARFRFDGVIDALGNTLMRQYVWQTRSYYLFDTFQHVVRIIPKDKPQLTSQVNLKKLPAFKKPRQHNEIQVILGVGNDTTAFYLNTVTHAMRYHAEAENE